jgi:hypothetical protein
MKNQRMKYLKIIMHNDGRTIVYWVFLAGRLGQPRAAFTAKRKFRLLFLNYKKSIMIQKLIQLINISNY